MSRLTELANSLIDLAVGAAVLASMVLGAVKYAFLRPLEKRVGKNEEDIDRLEDKADVAKERTDRHERVLLDPPNPQDDPLVEQVEETYEMVDETQDSVEEIREMVEDIK